MILSNVSVISFSMPDSFAQFSVEGSVTNDTGTFRFFIASFADSMAIRT